MNVQKNGSLGSAVAFPIETFPLKGRALTTVASAKLSLLGGRRRSLSRKGQCEKRSAGDQHGSEAQTPISLIEPRAPIDTD